MKPNLTESAYNDVGLIFCDKITYIDKGQVIFLIADTILTRMINF